MNLGGLKTDILRRLHLPDYEPITGGETAVESFINTVIDRVTRDAKLEKSQWSVATGTDKHFKIPDDCFFITRVTIDNVEINPTSREDLSGANSGWEGDAANTPLSWYYFEPDVVGLHPTPSASVTLEIEGWQLLDDLSSSSGASFLTRIFPEAIVYGVLEIILDSWDDNRSLKMGIRAEQARRKVIRHAKSAQGHRAGFRTPLLRDYERNY